MTWLQPQILWWAPVLLLPLLVVLLQWRRPQQLRWPAVRMLAALQRRHRFRIWWQRWGQVVLRACLVAALLLAWAGPRPSQAPAARERAPRACIVLVDDSASARRGDAFAQMQARLDDYLASLRSEDEVSLLRGSRLHAVVRPRFDHVQLRRDVQAWAASAGRSDLPALVAAGLAQLRHHVNDDVEMVLISDGADDGWGPDTEQVLARLDRLQRQRPLRLFLIQVAPDTAGRGNIALADAGLSHAQIGAGGSVRCVVRWQRWGYLDDGYQVRLRVNDQPVAQLPLPTAGQQGEVQLATSVLEPGQHLLTVELVGAGDVAAIDDQRYLPLTVLPTVPVTLVEGSEGAAHILQAVLRADSISWQPQRHHYAQWQGQDLSVPGILVLHSVPSLPPAVVASIERFLLQGGGVLVFGGANVDLAHWRGSWWREGDGFLPVAVADLQAGGVVQDAPGLPVELFRQQPWAIGQVHALADLSQAEVLLRLRDGRPLCVQRQRGAGRVSVWAGVQVDSDHAALPLLLRSLLHDAIGAPQQRRAYLVGERLRVLPARDPESVRLIQGPLGMLVPDPDGQGLRSPVLREPGGIVVSDGRDLLWYGVNVDPAECQPPQTTPPGVRARFAAVSKADWSQQPAFWQGSLRPLLLLLALVLLLLDWFLPRMERT